MKSLNIGIIGGGLAGLSAAGYLAKMGHKITILEKNDFLGGQVRTLKHNNFSFDTGVFAFSMISQIDRWFAQMGFDRADFFEMKKMENLYKIFFDQNEVLLVPSDIWQLKNLFERYESGAAHKLDLFLKNSRFKHDFYLDRLAYKNFNGFLDFFNDETTFNLWRLNIFATASNFNKKYFQNQHLHKILQLPFLFHGLDTQNSPAFFNFLNFSEFENGKFIVMGGSGKIAEGMAKVLEKMGVKILLNTEVVGVNLENMEIKKILAKNGSAYKNFVFDIVLNCADFPHFEQFLPPHYRTLNLDNLQNKNSWMTFCVALDKKIQGLDGVNIFYTNEFVQENGMGQKKSKIKTKKTDLLEKNNVLIVNNISHFYQASPENCHSLVLQIPLQNISDSYENRAIVFNKVIDLLEKRLVQNIHKHILFKRSFYKDDYKGDFNIFLGESFGSTVGMNRIFQNKIKNKSDKVLNLYYGGQNTNFVSGAVFSLISGQLVCEKIKEEIY